MAGNIGQAAAAAHASAPTQMELKNREIHTFEPQV